MKNYESPVIFDNEELAEGVYATGSGGAINGSSCWDVYTDHNYQRNADPYDLFVKVRIFADHNPVLHVSGKIKIVVSFEGGRITSAKFQEFLCTVSNGGTELILERERHANSYQNLDHFDAICEIKPLDENSARNLKISGFKWKCRREENVQFTAGPAGDLVDDYNGLTID